MRTIFAEYNPQCNSIDAVSYTHLDVYKRQLRCRNTLFHHAAGSLSDPRSFHHNRQVDDNHCSDSES